jgi:DNA-binding transcriptional ArsR family regulator
LKPSVPWDSLAHIARHGAPTHTHVLMTLLRSTSPITGKIKVTLDELADAANVSRKTVQRSLAWLSEHGIVSSSRLSGYDGKVYTVHNVRSLGAAPRVVTHDHPDWSPVTTLMPSDLGLCDPSPIVVPLHHEEVQVRTRDSRGTTSLYYTPEVYEVHSVNSDTVDPMILGADPDAPAVSAPVRTRPPKAKKPVAPSIDLLQYWNFLARRYSARPVTEVTDHRIFQSQVKRLLAKGLTAFSLRTMMSDFFQIDRHREHRTPHLVFFSTDVQRSLLPMTLAIDIDDPVLGWMASGFSDRAALSWSEEFCDSFQNVALRRGLSLMYRYPEVLASIAVVSDGDIDVARSLITDAQSLLDARLNNDSDAVSDLSTTLATSGVTLPADLTSGRRSLRDEAASLQAAVLAVRSPSRS